MSKTLYIDADTLVYSSAAQQQKDRLLVLNTKTHEETLFDGKRPFYKYLKDNDLDENDFLTQVKSELVGTQEFAFKAIREKVNNILKETKCTDYYVVIQGSGNFRNDIESEYVEYKANRMSKPILFQQCFDYMKRKYGRRCIVTQGIETDDFICAKAWESYNVARKSGNKDDAPYIIAYCDKDIVANSPGWFFNYRQEGGVFWVDNITQLRNFLTQTIVGDNADNIPGMLQVGPETKKKYSLRSNGCGPVAAKNILGENTTPKEMCERLLDAYRDSWPYDWKERLEDNCKFLYLQRFQGDQFNLESFFSRYGVTIDSE